MLFLQLFDLSFFNNSERKLTDLFQRYYHLVIVSIFGAHEANRLHKLPNVFYFHRIYVSGHELFEDHQLVLLKLSGTILTHLHERLHLDILQAFIFEIGLQ